MNLDRGRGADRTGRGQGERAGLHGRFAGIAAGRAEGESAGSGFCDAAKTREDLAAADVVAVAVDLQAASGHQVGGVDLGDEISSRSRRDDLGAGEIDRRDVANTPAVVRIIDGRSAIIESAAANALGAQGAANEIRGSGGGVPHGNDEFSVGNVDQAIARNIETPGAGGATFADIHIACVYGQRPCGIHINEPVAIGPKCPDRYMTAAILDQGSSGDIHLAGSAVTTDGDPVVGSDRATAQVVSSI